MFVGSLPVCHGIDVKAFADCRASSREFVDADGHAFQNVRPSAVFFAIFPMVECFRERYFVPDFFPMESHFRRVIFGIVHGKL